MMCFLDSKVEYTGSNLASSLPWLCVLGLVTYTSRPSVLSFLRRGVYDDGIYLRECQGD